MPIETKIVIRFDKTNLCVINCGLQGLVKL